MNTATIAVIRGDGIGSEVIEEGLKVLRAVGRGTATLSAKCDACQARAPMDDEFQRAKARLVAAEEALQGRDWFEFTGIPNGEAKKCAQFAAGVAYDLHKNLLRERPRIRWFRREEAPWEASDWLGFADTSGGFIALADHLGGMKLVEVTLHETRHLAQRGVSFTKEAAECDAERFAQKWLRPTLRAYRETDGALSCVAVSQWARPGGRPRHMDVVLTLPTAMVWQFNAHATGDSWRELPSWNEA